MSATATPTETTVSMRDGKFDLMTLVDALTACESIFGRWEPGTTTIQRQSLSDQRLMFGWSRATPRHGRRSAAVLSA